MSLKTKQRAKSKSLLYCTPPRKIVFDGSIIRIAGVPAIHVKPIPNCPILFGQTGHRTPKTLALLFFHPAAPQIFPLFPYCTHPCVQMVIDADLKESFKGLFGFLFAMLFLYTFCWLTVPDSIIVLTDSRSTFTLHRDILDAPLPLTLHIGQQLRTQWHIRPSDRW